MRSLTLQVEPVVGLEALGACELRELNWWRVRGLIQEAPSQDAVPLALLGETLFVDGEPIGPEALEALPGRLSAALAQVLTQCMALYAGTPDPAAAAGGEPPGES